MLIWSLRMNSTLKTLLEDAESADTDMIRRSVSWGSTDLSSYSADELIQVLEDCVGEIVLVSRGPEKYYDAYWDCIEREKLRVNTHEGGVKTGDEAKRLLQEAIDDEIFRLFFSTKEKVSTPSYDS